jgi:hypothetical protein
MIIIIIRKKRTDITTYNAYSHHLTIQEINFLKEKKRKEKRRTGSEFKTQDSFEKNLSDVLLRDIIIPIEDKKNK